MNTERSRVSAGTATDSQTGEVPGSGSPGARPFSGLTPDVVLDALDSVGLRGDGRMLALNSYENRVYRVAIADGSLRVAKFYRPDRWTDAQIEEEHAFVSELAAEEIPVVAPLALSDRTLHPFGGYRFSVYPNCGGRAPELDDRATREWLGRFVGRIHAVGRRAPFRERPRLDVASFGDEPREWLLSHGFVPRDLVEAYTSIVGLALDGVRRGFDRAGAIRSLRLHGDCHAGNVLWISEGANAGPHFVDFDDSRSGPAVHDLWMLLSGDRDEMTAQLADILAGYEGFCDFDRRELVLIEPLRTLRLVHYAAWLARRWDDPAFPAAFPWFNTQRYWQDRILELREQVAAMEEPPLEA
ncbi:MAG TPA: serine/threonine protein kinase [Casimicrobiaceae bacterium]|nr:serine/threonine protein kinase [Casimicrobiaceae bacterium]